MPGTVPGPLTVGSRVLRVRIFREWGSRSLCLAGSHIGCCAEGHQLCPECLTLLASVEGMLGPFPFASSTLLIALSRAVDAELSFGGGGKHGEGDGKGVAGSDLNRERFSQGDEGWCLPRHGTGSVLGRTAMEVLMSEAPFLQPLPHLVSHTSGPNGLRAGGRRSSLTPGSVHSSPPSPPCRVSMSVSPRFSGRQTGPPTPFHQQPPAAGAIFLESTSDPVTFGLKVLQPRFRRLYVPVTLSCFVSFFLIFVCFVLPLSHSLIQ